MTVQCLCGGTMEKRMVTIEDNVHGVAVRVTDVLADVCLSCGEQEVPLDTMVSLQRYAERRLGSRPPASENPSG